MKKIISTLILGTFLVTLSGIGVTNTYISTWPTMAT